MIRKGDMSMHTPCTYYMHLHIHIAKITGFFAGNHSETRPPEPAHSFMHNCCFRARCPLFQVLHVFFLGLRYS
ncbi:hypothetical protein DAI22_03g225300 [Oryza sativa Japonica Group]|nr:hypothetical protein DAI22_03g225300 [Oryza sativa Japonica Group]